MSFVIFVVKNTIESVLIWGTYPVSIADSSTPKRKKTINLGVLHRHTIKVLTNILRQLVVLRASLNVEIPSEIIIGRLIY